jgi:hypothetical protein
MKVLLLTFVIFVAFPKVPVKSYNTPNSSKEFPLDPIHRTA